MPSCSTRSSSTAVSCPTTAWSARSTAAGGWPAPRWPTSGSRSPRTRPSAAPSKVCWPGWPPVPSCRTRSPSTGSVTCWPRPSRWPSWVCGPRCVRWAGCSPAPESSLRKLLGAEFEQRVHEFGLDLCGPDGAVTEGEAAVSAHGVLQSKCLTIAGGTSEVQRNVIGERLLGPAPGSGARPVSGRGRCGDVDGAREC